MSTVVLAVLWIANTATVGWLLRSLMEDVGA